MAARAEPAFRPGLIFAYNFSQDGADGPSAARRLAGHTAQERQQNAQRGHSLRRMNIWNALRRTGQTDDNQTVEQTTAGMGAEQRDAWLQQQLNQTVNDMVGKGLQLDRNNIGTAYFASPESPRRGTGVDHWSGKDHVEVNRDDVRHLTVKELRSVMAREVAHTQQKLDIPWNQAENAPEISAAKRNHIADEKPADQAAAFTYGAKTYNNALRKLYAVPDMLQSPTHDGRGAVLSDGSFDPHAPPSVREKDANRAKREVRPQPQAQQRQSPLSR